MSYRFLYYPYFSVPNGGWLRKVLLYSDKVATIVPATSFARRYTATHMRVLADAGEMHFLRPEVFLADNEHAESFELDVMDMLTSPEFSQWNSGRRDAEPPVRLAADKITPHIVRWLSQTGLTEVDRDWDSYLVPARFACIYVGLLAQHMAQRSNEAWTPCTDKSSQERLAFSRCGRHAVHPVLSILFSRALPVPGPETSLTDIVAFKRKRWDELLSHRTLLREFERRLSTAGCDLEIMEIADQYAEQVELSIHRIERLMEESRMRRAISSLKALVDVKIEGLPSIVTSGLKIGLSLVSALAKPLIPQSERAFSYVFHASERFGNCQPWRGWGNRTPAPGMDPSSLSR